MSASNVCPACGAANGPTNLFCINCGKPLSAPMPTQPYPPAAAPVYPPPAAPGFPPAVPPMYPAGAYPGSYPYTYGPPPRRATFSSILSAMFDVWTKNFVNFFVVYLVISLVTGLLGVAFFYALFGTFDYSPGAVPGVTPTPTSVDFGRVILLVILVAIASVIINSIVVGGMTEFAVRRYRGEAMTVGQALRRGLDRFLSIFGANLLLTILIVGIFVLPIALIAVAFLGSGGNPTAALGALCGGVLTFVVGGIIALYVIVATSLYAPAIMMENQRATDGLMRSWQLTKGYRWSIFWAGLVTIILVGIISVVITTPAGLAENVWVNVVASALATGIVGAWFVILTAVAYDLIVRTPTYGPPPYLGPIGVPPATGPTSPPSPPAAPPPAGP